MDKPGVCRTESPSALSILAQVGMSVRTTKSGRAVERRRIEEEKEDLDKTLCLQDKRAPLSILAQVGTRMMIEWENNEEDEDGVGDQGGGWQG